MTTTSQSGVQHGASAAADEGRHLGHVAGGEARNVAGQAADQARDVAREITTQAEDQARIQRDRLTNTLQSFSRDLDQMAEGSPGGMARQAAYFTADQARRLSERIDGREPQDLLDDVRAFARRRPGVFLLGSLAAGVVAGRLLRGAKDASSGSSSSSPEATGPAYDPDQAGLDAGPPATAAVVDEPVPPTVTTTPVVEPPAPVTGADPVPGTHRGAP